MLTTKPHNNRMGSLKEGCVCVWGGGAWYVRKGEDWCKMPMIMDLEQVWVWKKSVQHVWIHRHTQPHHTTEIGWSQLHHGLQGDSFAQCYSTISITRIKGVSDHLLDIQAHKVTTQTSIWMGTRRPRVKRDLSVVGEGGGDWETHTHICNLSCWFGLVIRWSISKESNESPAWFSVLQKGEWPWIDN